MRKLIGKGTFTKAYQVADDTVEIVTKCPTKECYAMFSQHNPLAPKIERTNTNGIFKMPLYPKVKAPKKQLKEEHYALYRILSGHRFSGIHYHAFVKEVESHPDISEQDKENIVELAGDVCNGIDPMNMRFEISPRNISATPEGDLVMMDCFFSRDLLLNSRPRA